MQDKKQLTFSQKTLDALQEFREHCLRLAEKEGKTLREIAAREVWMRTPED